MKAQTEVHFSGNFYDSTADRYGAQPIKFNLKDVTLSQLTGLVAQGSCIVTPKNGTPYQCGLFAAVASFSSTGFVLYPITPFNGEASYKYDGSYIGIGLTD